MTETDQVLVVDDNELIRAMVSDAIQEAGCRPVLSSTATEAIGALATLQPLAAFIDLHMPDASGDDCCKIIKSSDDLVDVPVLMMTAADSDTEVQRAFSAGADDYLPKPIRPHQVMSKIRAIREGLRLPVCDSQPALKTILVADDQLFFRQLVGRTLERAGYEVAYAETGLDALRVLNRGRPEIDLCVLDLVMPGMGGLDLVRKLRGIPRWSDFPIVVVSGSHHSPSAVSDLRQLKIDHLIHKDLLNLDDLLSRVNVQLFNGPETRQASRARYYRVCEFRPCSDGDWRSGFIYSLSANGVAVRTLTAPPTGTALDLRFNVSAELKLSVRANVVWSNQYNPRDGHSFPYGIGLKFGELSDETRGSIQRALSTALDN